MSLKKLFELAGVPIPMKLTEMGNSVNREEMINKLIDSVSDWETDALFGFMQDILSMLTDQQLQQLLTDNGFV